MLINYILKQFRSWKFPGSARYWIRRYDSGRNSGAGSYSNLAEFKAEIINQFAADHCIRNVIELGCGDGNQLRLAHYPEYTGYDISHRALQLCKTIFMADPAKKFYLMDEYDGRTAELALSLDVIYHLVEDEVFINYMSRLFDCAYRYVIIYSSNTSRNNPGQAMHVRHRVFTDWIRDHRPDWVQLSHILNKYPYKSTQTGDSGSLAEFYIFKKAGF